MTRAVLILAAVLLVSAALASHEQWTIVREKQLVDEMCMTDRYYRVERCTGLTAPLPRLARVQPRECYTEPGEDCLPDGRGGAYFPDDQTIALPDGNGRWAEHEFVHHLKWVNQGDLSHNGDEWRCE